MDTILEFLGTDHRACEDLFAMAAVLPDSPACGRGKCNRAAEVVIQHGGIVVVYRYNPVSAARGIRPGLRIWVTRGFREAGQAHQQQS